MTRGFSVEPAIVLGAALGTVAVFCRPITRDRRAIGSLCLGVVGLVLLSYLFFRSFPDWWYLRLLLPAYPALAVLAGLGVSWLGDKLYEPVRLALLGCLAIVVGYHGVTKSLELDVNRSRENESRYADVGRFVSEQLPRNSVVFAFQHSGSVRYYANRLTVRFDVLHGDWLDPALVALRAQGYTPYFVVEEEETALFTERFAARSPRGWLDWPPLAELHGPVTVRVFDPRDHRRHHAGEPLTTREIAASY